MTKGRRVAYGTACIISYKGIRHENQEISRDDSRKITIQEEKDRDRMTESRTDR